MNEQIVLPINPMDDGTCRTIKSQYGKNGVENLENQKTFGATGVMKVEVLGGLGEKTSNGGTQFFNQHRIYDTEQLCTALNACEVIPKICDTLLVKQATKDGYIPCKIGGGGGFEFPRQYNTQRKSDRERTDKSNSDNGEYP